MIAAAAAATAYAVGCWTGGVAVTAAADAAALAWQVNWIVASAADCDSRVHHCGPLSCCCGADCAVAAPDGWSGALPPDDCCSLPRKAVRLCCRWNPRWSRNRIRCCVRLQKDNIVVKMHVHRIQRDCFSLRFTSLGSTLSLTICKWDALDQLCRDRTNPFQPITIEVIDDLENKRSASLNFRLRLSAFELVLLLVVR